MAKKDAKVILRDKFLLLNAIHNKIEFINNENKKAQENTEMVQDQFSNYMIMHFLQNPNIIFTDKNYFCYLIKEIDYFLNENENIILPFIDACPKLVKAYIESDLDEEKIGEYKYMNIFSDLIKSSFINKENLFPIYSFFSDLFSDITTIQENDIRLKKLIKLVDLWLIFYSFTKTDKNGKENEFKKSSICFLGGSLTVHFKDEISSEGKIFEISINFLRNDYINFIKEEKSFLTINYTTLITYKEIQKYLKDKIYSLTIIVEHKKITVNFNYTDHSDNSKQRPSKSKDKIKSFSKSVNFPRIRDIIFLDDFYGEVESVTVVFKKIINKKQTEVCFENIYKAYKETLSGYLKRENDDSNSYKDIESLGSSIKKTNKMNILLKITDRNFAKVNYINYGDENFNIVEYFGNPVQILPFAYIIQKLFINDNIKVINGEDKNKVCFIFLDKILNGFCNCILYSNYNNKIIKKYFLFVYSIILEIVIAYNKHNQDNNDKNLNIREILTNIFIFSNMNKFDQSEFLINFYIKLINSFGENSYESTIRELVGNVLVTEKKSYPYADTEDFIKLYYLLPECTYSQLYRKLMKELFVYNRMWAQKDLFFKVDNSNNSQSKVIKYKQMSYFTKNFQQPILYPILEIEKYYPVFSRFKLEKLYKNKNQKILSYNFSLTEDNYIYVNNIITKYIEKYLKKQQNQEKCCLVKQTHHVKGSISIIEMDYNGMDCFELYFFSSTTQNTDPICNDITGTEEKEKEANTGDENQRNLCYGSVFPCPIKDYGIILNIKSKDILFILIREYYRRVSAIEIFTADNKSYFFNFNNFFVNDKSKNLNELLKKISNYFEKIKINIAKQDKSILLGFYNPDYQQYLYPLFSEEINVWKKKNKCYTNYDKLILINLLSNRSFKDIYQYPVFPMIYEHIGLKEREMNKHIGLLDINEDSIQRKKLFIESYDISVDEKKFQEEPEEVFLFNTYYSNPIYTCNYLIRIFPYSFLGIEFQGEGFDDPNRLFYSLPITMKNTLSHKSDIREMIPELFYMPEIFQNGNELELNKISNGEDIDNVQFLKTDSNTINTNNAEDNSNNAIDENIDNSENFQKFKFLREMRESLDNEKKINQWIDLIFGVEQKETESHQLYFSKQSYISYENNSELFNNTLSLQSIEFGLIPFQLFYEKFPSSYNYMQFFYLLKSENKARFEAEHKSDHDPKQCFIFRGRSFISSKYLDIVNDASHFNNISNDEEKKDNQINVKEKMKYTFIGDVFGFVTILSKKIKKPVRDRFKTKIKETNNNNNNNNNDKKKNNNNNTNIKTRPTITVDPSNEDNENEYNIIIRLSDHYKQIKYIDYNPRLNLFLTYALDGYINIYTFPKIKLVKVLKFLNYCDNEDDFLRKVVLISNPFPMIFCHNLRKMYVFSINGELIRSRAIEPGTEILPCIDKDLGLIRDHVEMITRQNKNTVLCKDVYFPSI